MSDDDDSVLYRFSVGGEGCERCQALDGSLWTEAPPPPHPYCQCLVETVAGDAQSRECGDNRWTMEYERTENYSIDSFKYIFKVTIECWDGATTEFESEVDYGSDSSWPHTSEVFDIWNELAWSELYDEAEEVAAQFCQPCQQPLVS